MGREREGDFSQGRSFLTRRNGEDEGNRQVGWQRPKRRAVKRGGYRAMPRHKPLLLSAYAYRSGRIDTCTTVYVPARCTSSEIFKTSPLEHPFEIFRSIFFPLFPFFEGIVNRNCTFHDSVYLFFFLAYW